MVEGLKTAIDKSNRQIVAMKNQLEGGHRIKDANINVGELQAEKRNADLRLM